MAARGSRSSSQEGSTCNRTSVPSTPSVLQSPPHPHYLLLAQPHAAIAPAGGPWALPFSGAPTVPWHQRSQTAFGAGGQWLPAG